MRNSYDFFQEINGWPSLMKSRLIRSRATDLATANAFVPFDSTPNSLGSVKNRNARTGPEFAIQASKWTLPPFSLIST